MKRRAHKFKLLYEIISILNFTSHKILTRNSIAFKRLTHHELDNFSFFTKINVLSNTFDITQNCTQSITILHSKNTIWYHGVFLNMSIVINVETR